MRFARFGMVQRGQVHRSLLRPALQGKDPITMLLYVAIAQHIAPPHMAQQDKEL